MNRRRLAPLRVAGALALILWWLVATNHCALAIALSGSTHTMGACGHCAPTKPPCQNGMLPCCQSLKASLPGVTRAPVGAAIGSLASIQPDSVCASIEAASEIGARYDSRGGSPPAAFFISVVLQRVLPAHGPPARIS